MNARTMIAAVVAALAVGFVLGSFGIAGAGTSEPQPYAPATAVVGMPCASSGSCDSGNCGSRRDCPQGAAGECGTAPCEMGAPCGSGACP